MAVMKDLVQLNNEIQEQKDRIDTVDFKMITFSLAGKDYGVDIMNVKEIAKADKFTYVPNAASFVRGVYNLRGDIIPIIDLRLFFHLPVGKRDALENMLILRIGDHVYGTIVDKIDKVVGINTENIQPPHPIFGDINIKYISGVVEKQGNLYIILDVIRIFTQSEEDKQKPRGVTEDSAAAPSYYKTAAAPVEAVPSGMAAFDSVIGFIKESLPALKQFYPSDINDIWIRARFADWSATRAGDNLQLKGVEEAEEYLSNFFSPDTGRFWSDDYAAFVKSLLPNINSKSVQVWNIGCGKGYETYSFACILKSRYPGCQIRIWANDVDIMSISQAPNMIFDLEDVPEFCRNYVVKGKSGFGFGQEIKDSVTFEYHDILNENPLPELDIVLVRDVMSFLQVSDQEKIVASFREKLKSRGIVIMGRNEILPGADWEYVGKEPVSIFKYTG